MPPCIYIASVSHILDTSCFIYIAYWPILWHTPYSSLDLLPWYRASYRFQINIRLESRPYTKSYLYDSRPLPLRFETFNQGLYTSRIEVSIRVETSPSYVESSSPYHHDSRSHIATTRYLNIATNRGLHIYNTSSSLTSFAHVLRLRSPLTFFTRVLRSCRGSVRIRPTIQLIERIRSLFELFLKGAGSLFERADFDRRSTFWEGKMLWASRPSFRHS